MKKVLIAVDEVDKWSRLCEGLQNEWECTTVNLDAFEKFHTIAVYDAVFSANMIWCFVHRLDLIIEEYFHAA